MEFLNFINQYGVLRENILLQRFVIILVYGVLAKVGDIIINRILKRIAAKTRMGFDDKLIKYFRTPAIWTIFSLGVLHAVATGPPLSEPWQLIVPQGVKSTVLIFWLFATIRYFNWLVDYYLHGDHEKGRLGSDLFMLLKNILRVVVIVAGLLWLLSIWQINLTPLFASAGIAGIAVALAAKDTLANFFGGISIYMDKTYKVGEYIILESGERGEVVEIGIRSTRIKTRDDVIVTIPNSIIANSKIINESAPIPRFRIRVPVGVAYGSDLEKVEKVLLEVAEANENIEKEPEPRVRLREFADSSVNFELLCWVKDPRDKGLEVHHLSKAAYNAFDQQGITIPFPQRDIHIKTPGPASFEAGGDRSTEEKQVKE